MSSPDLQFSLLGPPVITLNGRPFTVDRRKAIALLIYLAITGGYHQREALAAMFWPSYDQSRAHANLRQTLLVLKKALEDTWLIVDRAGVHLQPGFELDVTIFSQTITTAITKDFYTIELSHLQRAVQLYRDTFLVGFTLPDAPLFDEWQFFQAQRFSQDLETALQLLVKGYSHQQEWEKAIQYGQRWLTVDPLNELAHTQLMQLYAQTGRKAAVLQQYELCQQILAQELGISPKAETKALYDKLLNYSVTDCWQPESLFQIFTTPKLPVTEIPAPGPLPPGSQMPFRANPLFTGRETELQQLARALRADTAVAVGQMVVATGLGGLGKTQLAVEFGHRYGRYFPGGVFWLNFAAPESIPAEIARCGGVDGLAICANFDELKLNEQVKLVQKAWQEPISRLLIIDNCEDEALLAQWRPSTGGCRILVTSRRGRWDPVLGITTVPLDVLKREESITLLQRFVPDLLPSNADLIADQLGDLPLALHLAGSFLVRYKQAMTPASYLAQLQQPNRLEHPSLAGRKAGYSPTRHEQHIARTFALSYEQLDPIDQVDQAARALLARAACLAPGEPITVPLLKATLQPDNLSQVGDADTLLVEDALARLIELGLLEEKTCGTVWLHRLLAFFVQAVMDDPMAQTAVEKTLLLTLSQQVDSVGYIPIQSPLTVHLRAVANAAWPRRDKEAADLCYWLGYSLWLIGDYPGSQLYLERALDIRKQKLGMEHEDTATCLNLLGLVLWSSGNPGAARSYIEQALPVFQQKFGHIHPQTARCLNNLAGLFWTMEDFSAALPYTRQALEIREQILGAEHPETAQSLSNLGTILMYLGNLSEAQGYLEQALVVRKRILEMDHPDIAASLDNLGYLLQKLGRTAEALPYHQQALSIFEKVLGSNHLDTAICLDNLGDVSQVMGRLDEAKIYYTQVFNIRMQTLGPNHPDTQRIQKTIEALNSEPDFG